ncbi:MAG TPA: TonB-dependent receptor [Marinospirillum sp.]|uniref:TonB-dependent receptor plug domain-containing protein n=1 Tax=Marinospirillum sp. TaxID=2183934 RepID=UPI002B49CA48|nr:TonB-dependent receptor [Marinospirillum sp.]HKM15018.1 TonB-dependent receptor [Marinospirillum sp.]
MSRCTFSRLAFLGLVLAAPYLQAESLQESSASSIKVSRLDNILVTGTRTERALVDIPVRTQVISAADIEKNHAKDLQEALSHVPGLQLRPIHGKTGYGVWLQGIDANRVLILVDGNPVSASTGSAVDTSQIAVTDIERIEIIKGAASAMYGTSAMGGVVNIITRQHSQPISASVTASGGSWGDQDLKSNALAQRHLKGQIALNNDAWSFNLMGDVRDQDGWTATPNSISNEGFKGYKRNLASQVQYRFSPDFKFTLSPRIYQEDLTNGLSEFAPGIGNIKVDKKEQTTTLHLGARLEKGQKDAFNWSINALTETFKGETAQDKPSTQWVDQQRDTDIDQQLVTLQINYPLGNHHLSFGGQVSEETMDVVQYKRTGSTTERLVEVDNATASNQELFLQDSWFIGEHLELLPGFRVHHDKDAGTHFSPMMNSLFFKTFDSGDRINLRLGVGNGYRVANLKERYFVFDHSQFGYKVMGNPDLEPESSISYQAGIEWLKASNNARLELSLFRNDITDLIESDQDLAESAIQNLQIFRYQNFEKARTQGAELVLHTPLGLGFSFDLGYTWMEATDRMTGNDLPSRPEHLVKLGLDWQTPLNGLVLTAKAKYESQQFTDSENTNKTPAFTVLDLKANYTLNPHWRIFSGVNNATNTQKDFTQADNRPEEGRFIYLGMGWKY